MVGAPSIAREPPSFSDGPFGAHFDLYLDGSGGDLVIDDAELVFSGSYARSGNDLIISRPFETATLHGYFKGFARPAIHAPDGSGLTGAVVCALTLNVGGDRYAENAAPSTAPKAIGRVESVKGEGQLIRNGQMIALHVGDLVYKGDAVQTGGGSQLSLIFLDGTAFTLDADARMVLNDMVYDPKSTSNTSLLTLVQGSIGFVAGDVAHKGEMDVDTPVAVIGIRGTAVHVTIDADHGRTHYSVMREPSGRVGRYVLYDHGHPPKALTTVEDVNTVTTLDLVNGVLTFSNDPKTANDVADEKSLNVDVYAAFQSGQQHPLRAQLGLDGPVQPQGHNQGNAPPGSPPLVNPEPAPENGPNAAPTPFEPQTTPLINQPTPSPTPSTFAQSTTSPASAPLLDAHLVNPINVISAAQGGVIGADSMLSTLNLLSGATDGDSSATLSLLENASGLPIVTVGVLSGAYDPASVTYSAGANGTLQIDPSQFQAVTPGTTVVLEFHYTLVDSSGAQAPQTALLTIDGGSAVSYGRSTAPIEVGASAVTLTPSVTSPEGGDSFAIDPPGALLVTQKGAYGTAVINTATGQIVYTPSAPPGVSGTDTFTISDTDAAGVTTKTALAFAVDGGASVHYATLSTPGPAVVDTPTLVSPAGGDEFAFLDASGSSLVEIGRFGTARISATTGQVTYTPSGLSGSGGADAFTVSDTDAHQVTTTTTASFFVEAAVAPTIAGTAAGQPTAEETPVRLFSGVSVGDGNVGASETLTITLAGGGGVLSGNGLVAGEGAYTLTGTAVAVTSALDALTFTPNAGSPGSVTTTTFTLSDKSSAFATPTVDAATSVIDTDAAVAPTIAGTAANQPTADETPVRPFAGVSVGEGNVGASETLTIALAGGGGVLTGAGLSESAGSYTLTGTAGAVTSALDALTFTPSAATPGAPATTTFTLSDKSSAFATPTVDAATSVVDTDAAVAPTIAGTAAGQPTADETPVRPFAGVIVEDANVGASETLTIALSGGGGTLSGTGLSGGSGTYALTGTAAAVTSALDALTFTPNAAAPGAPATTTFTLSDKSSAFATPTVDAATSVVDTDAAVAPTIAGTAAGQPTADETPVRPFAGVIVEDANVGASETLTIALSGGGGTLSGTGLSGGSGTYALTGTAAAVTSALDALTFTPNAAAPGAPATTTFTLSDKSSAFATPTENAATSVVDTDAAVAPTISGTAAGQPTADETPVRPFSGVSVGDANVGATETLTITLAGGGGTLSGTGLAAAAGGYTLTGTAGAVTSALDALTFTPSAAAPGAPATTTFTLSDKSSAFATPTVDASTSVVDTDAAVAPTIAGTAAGQPTANETPVRPFSGVSVEDANVGATETLTITLAGGGGTLSGTGLAAAAGSYTLTGTAGAVTSALDALTFTPNAAAPGAPATTTFTLSDKSSAFATPTVDASTSVVDTDAAVAPTISGTAAGQPTANETPVRPFAAVAIGDGNINATETLTIALSGGGGTLSGTGLSESAGSYTLTGAAGAVTSALDALTFTPSAATPGAPATTTFTLSDKSSAFATPTVDAATSVVDTDAAVAPTIAGTAAGQPTANETPVRPFSGVSVGDANVGATETLTIALSGGGGTLSGTGLSESAGGYTLTGTAGVVTGELDALTFTPNAAAPGAPATTTFTLSDKSSAFATPTVDAAASVIDTDGAVAPTIAGTAAGQPTANETPVRPFSGVSVEDANAGATETLTIALSGGGGTLSGAGLSGGSGTYTLTGTAGAVTSALDALTFTPSAGSPGSVATTTFTLSDKSSAFATPTVDAATSVIDTDAAVAPTISGTAAGQPTANETPVHPFAAVAIGDGNVGATETLTITLSGGGGTLSGTGLVAGEGAYTLAGTAGAVTSALDALTFTPNVGTPGAPATTTFTLSDTSSAFATPTVDAATSVVDTDAAVAPTIAGTVANQPTANETPVRPFSGVSVEDANAGASETLTITLAGGGGVLTGAGLSESAGSYTLTGTAGAVTGELDALTFTPNVGSPGGVTTTTFTLSDKSSAFATPTGNAATSVIDTDATVAPTIAGTVADQPTADETPVHPFAAAAIGDGNINATETLTIALSGGGGTLSGTGLSGGSGTYTLTGTAGVVTGELDALTFTPNVGSPGSVTTTTFTLSDKSSAFATPTENAATSVIDTDGAVAPTISGTAAGQPTANETPVNPFGAVAIGDANVGATETLTITLAGGGGVLTGAGLSESAGSYTLTGTAGAVTSALDALTFTPNAGSPGSVTTTTFTLSDKSSAFATPTVDAATSVIDTDAAVAPTIAGTAAGQPTANETPVRPFSGVSVGDGNAGSTETLTIMLSGGGGTLSGTGLSESAGSYTLTGTAAAVTSALDALTFTPSAATPGAPATTTFTLSDKSSAFATPTVDAATSVIDTDAAVAPTIAGTVAGQPTANETPVRPFSGVSVEDANAGATETLTITLSSGGGTLSGTGLSESAGSYTLTGTAGAVTGELDALTFTPNVGSPGSVTTTTFTLSDKSSAFATPTVDAATSVIDTDAAVAPTIAGTVADQPTANETPVRPFSGVSVEDANVGATETLTIALSGGGGTLSGTGLVAGEGTYTLTGTAAAVTSALDALTFTPNAATPGAPATTTFTLSDKSSAFATPTVDAATSVIDTDAAVAPTIAGTAAGQPTANETPVHPFAGVIVEDANVGASETLTIALSGGGGVLSGTGLSGGSGTYALTGTAAAVTSALDALTFTPNAATPGSVTTTTFTLSDKSSAFATPTVDAATSVVDTDGAVAPTIAGTAAGQPTANETPVRPFAGASVEDANVGATETLTITLAGGGGTLSGTGLVAGEGGYTLTGTAGAVTSALDALTFTPNVGSPGSVTTTTFTLSDKSSAFATPTVDAATSVIDADAAVAPTIAGTVADQPTANETPVHPFAAVAIGDGNVGASETLTIALSGGGGTLSGTGLVAGEGAYTLAGTAGAVTSALDALTFTPNVGTPGAPATTTFTLSDTSSAFATPTVDAATSVVDTDAAVAPTIAGTVANQPTANETPVRPFSGVSVEDANAGASETLTITLAGGGGVLTGAGLSESAGSYTLTGTAGAVTGELDALTFTPNVGSPGGVTTTTFTLSDKSSAFATPTGNAATSVIDTDATVAPTIAGTVADQPTANETPVRPFSAVSVGDANVGATETLTIALSGGGGTLSGTGLVAGEGAYTLTGTAGAVTGELDALTFTPHAGSPGSVTTTTFTLSDKSSAFATPTVDAATSVVDTDAAVAPTIAGTVAGQPTANETPVRPFATVSVEDANAGATETLTITLSGGGGTLSGAGLVAGEGAYTLTGTAAAVTSELDALTFTPGAPATTTFTLSDKSSAFATPTMDAATSVVDTDAAVAPTIAGTVAGQPTANETPVRPFSGVSVEDANVGATETLTIALSGGGGTLSGTGLVAGEGTYTLTGTAAAVTGELDALTFTPNAAAPGAPATTTFTLSDKSSAFATPTVDAATSVVDTDAAVAPTIAGTVAGQPTANETPVRPFATVSVGDGNVGATETLTIALSGGGGTLSGTGLSESAGSYTLTGTAGAVTSALDALLFTPNVGTPGSVTTTTFTLSDKSSAFATPTVDAATSVVDTDGAVAPTIAGTAAGQPTANETPVQPFAAVAIGDGNVGATETLTIALSGGGGTLSGTGLVAGEGAYTLTGTAAAVTGELDALTFTPNVGSPGSVTTTTFTLSDKSSAFATPTVDPATSVVDTDGAVAPTISGTIADQPTANETPVRPFSAVAIGDGNVGASETLTITLAGGGVLTGAGLSGGSGTYTLAGTAGAVTSALDALTFTPNAATPGAPATTTFTLSDKSSAFATPTVDAATSVVDTDAAVAPTISGTAAGQPTANETPVRPFSAVAIGDGNVGASETLTITLAGGGGVLTGAGLSESAGSYTLTGTAAAVTGALDALTFMPNAGTPGSVTTTTFTLSDKSSAFATPTVDAATSVVDTDAAVAPTIAGTAAGQPTANETPMHPFSAVAIGDGNVGASETLTIALSGGGGTLSGTGLSESAGSYTLTGTVAAVTGELDALTFTPNAAAPGAPATTTFTLSDKSSAFATPTVDAATSVIDTDAAVAPTIAGTVADQATANETPVRPFAAVAIGDGNVGATETLTIALSGGGGTLSGTGLVAGEGAYTLTGTAGVVTDELDALTFTPNAATPGAPATTTFTLSDKSSAYATPTVDAATSVVDTDAAVAPTIAGTVTGQPTANETPVRPFSGVSVGDGNVGASETLTIALSGGGGVLTGAGLSESAGGYTLTGTAGVVTDELDALTFTPNAATPGAPATTTFTLSDKSSAFSTPTVDAATSVIDTDAAVAPTIAGTVADQPTANETPVHLFAGVSVEDANVGASETLTIALSGGGGTLSGTGLVAGEGGYTLTGTAGAVTSALDALLFTPNVGSPGSVTTTTFTLSDKSSAFATPTVDAATSVIDTDAAVVPTIAGTAAGQPTADETPVRPFSGVSVGDGNVGATETLTITLAGGGGTLSGTGLVSGEAAYTLTGTAAAVTGELDALTFTPNAGTPGSVTTTTFTLSDKSSAFATPTVDASTSVVDTDAAVAPTIAGTAAGQPTANETPVRPFAGVSVGDANAGATETLTITLAGGGGTLSGTGLVAGEGAYTLTGTAAAVTGELDALLFTPNAGTPGAPATTTFTLSDKSSAFATPTVDAATSVVDTDSPLPSITPVVTFVGPLLALEGSATLVAGLAVSGTGATAGDTLTVYVSDEFGALSAAGAVGNGSSQLTIQGTYAAVNQALSALTVTETQSGSDAITVVADDPSGSSSGPAVITTLTPALAPTVSAHSAINVAVGVLNAVSGLSLAEVDATAAETFTVSISASDGVMTATGAQGDGTGTLTLSGDLSAINSALSTLTFTASSAGSGAISLTASDSFGNVGATTSLEVNASALAPVVEIGVNPIAVNEGVGSALPGVSISEADAPASETFAVTLVDGLGKLSVVANGAVVSGNGSTALSLSGSLVEINAALASLSDLQSGPGGDNLTISATDSQTHVSQTLTVAVASNDPIPNLSTPGSFSVLAEVATALSGVSLSAPGALANETFKVTLTDTYGLITSSAAGVSGSGTTDLTVSGSLGQVNAALASVKILETQDQDDSLSLQATDSVGNVYSAQPLAVTVVGPPQIVARPSETASAGLQSTLYGVNLSEQGASPSETFRATLSDLKGLLYATGPGVSGSGTNTLIVAGTIYVVDNALATLAIKDASVGDDTITIAADDSLGQIAATQTIGVTATGAGQNYTWAGATSDLGTAGNWSLNGATATSAPSYLDIASFTGPATISGTLHADQLNIGSAVTISSNVTTTVGGYTFIGVTPGATAAAVTVDASAPAAEAQWLNTSVLDVGETAAGALTIGAGGVVTNLGGISIGSSAGGPGTLTVQDGGHLFTADFDTLGSVEGALGTATVEGVGSEWISTSLNFVVGNFGDGVLTVSDDALVSVSDLVVGANWGGLSGGAATGQVYVESGAKLVATGDSATIGEDAGGEGFVTVEGSALWSAGNVVLGDDGGTGTLTLDDGRLNALSVSVGNNYSGAETASVGALVVEAGGALLTTGAYDTIGQSAGGQGTVTVEGSGSTWNAAGTIIVGNLASGQLIISAGGAVVAGVVQVGENYGGAPGSTATGSLRITSGGSLTTTGSYAAVGEQTGGSGTAVVDGAGSLWKSVGVIDVGDDGGVGNLTISDGAEVLAQDIQVGDNWNGPATDNSSGAVLVESGGQLRTTGTYEPVGVIPGGSGTVTVTGAGSSWIADGSFELGGGGASSLAATSGGVILAAQGIDPVQGATITVDQSSSIVAGSQGGASLGYLTVDPLPKNYANVWGAGTIDGNVMDLGNVYADHGTLVIDGSVAGDGFLTVGGMATLSVSGGVTLTPSAQNPFSEIDFYGWYGDLALADPAGVKATIANFVPGDTLDLTQLTYDANASSYSYAVVNGVGELTITEGAISYTLDVAAAASLEGNLHLSPDASGGGTAIAFANAPASPFLLWSSLGNFFSTPTGPYATGATWSTSNEAGSDNPVWVADETTGTGAGPQTYNIVITAQNALGEQQGATETVATTTLIDPFGPTGNLAAPIVFVGANYVDSSAAVVWWQASATTGAYDFKFETFTDQILNVTTSTPAIALSGNVETLLHAVTDPTDWRLWTTSSGFTLEFTTAASATTKNVFVEAFNASGVATTSLVEAFTGISDNLMINTALGDDDNIYWSVLNGSQSGFYGETFNTATGQLGSAYQIFSSTNFSAIYGSGGSGYLSNGDDLQFVDGLIDGQHVIEVAELGPNLVDLGIKATIPLSVASAEGFDHIQVYDPDTDATDYTILAYLDAGQVHLDLFDDDGKQIGSTFIVPGATSLLRLHDINEGSRFEIDYTTSDGQGGQNIVGAIYDTAAWTKQTTVSGGGLWAGTPYDDVFTWGAGVYVIDGGGGTDTFDASNLTRAQTTITMDAQGQVIVSDAAGDVDTLRRFSTIELADATIAINGDSLMQTNADGSRIVSIFNIPGGPFVRTVTNYGPDGVSTSETYYNADGSIYFAAPATTAITAQTPEQVEQGEASPIVGISVSEAGALADETFTVTVSDVEGALAASGPVSGSGTTSLTIFGSLAAVNAALGSLTVLESVAGNDNLTIGAHDNQGGSLSATTISIEVGSQAAVAPTITGTAGQQSTLNEAPVTPFAGVTIGDANAGASETLTITLTGAGGTLSGVGLILSPEGYALTGTAAGVTSELDALVFTPNAGAPNSQATTSFTLSDQSGAYAAPTVDATTSVVDADVGPGEILWANASGGDWDQPGNWSSDVVPVSTEGVAILKPVTVTVSVDDNIVDQILSVPQASLQISGGTLEIADSATIEGAVILSGGALIVDGSASIGSLSQFGSGVLSGSGTVTVTGSASFTGGSAFETGNGATILQGGGGLSGGVLALDAGRTLQNDGVFNWSGGTVYLGYNPSGGAVGGATLANAAGATFDDQIAGSIYNNNGVNVFTNAGTFETSFASGVTTIDVTFGNTGTVSVGAGGTLDLSGGVTGAGGFQIGNLSTLEFGSSVAAGKVTFGSGSGQLTIDDPSGFNAEIAGISGTGDIILLKGIAAAGASASSAGAYDPSTGLTTLTFTEAGGETLAFQLVGDYDGSTWNLTSTGAGAELYDPPASGAPTQPATIAHAQTPFERLIAHGGDAFVFKTNFGDHASAGPHTNFVERLSDGVDAKAHPFAAYHALLAEASDSQGETIPLGVHWLAHEGVHKGDVHSDLFAV